MVLENTGHKVGDWKKRKKMEVGYVLTGGRKAGDSASSKEPRESQMQIHDIFQSHATGTESCK